jgi:hypothetical protein
MIYLYIFFGACGVLAYVTAWVWVALEAEFPGHTLVAGLMMAFAFTVEIALCNRFLLR